jgi:hypothetical protein
VFFEQTGDAAIGLLAYDYRKSVQLDVLFDVEESDAQACLDAVNLATAWVHGLVIIKSDCSAII